MTSLNMPERMHELSDVVIRPVNATRDARRGAISEILAQNSRRQGGTTRRHRDHPSDGCTTRLPFDDLRTSFGHDQRVDRLRTRLLPARPSAEPRDGRDAAEYGGYVK